MPYTKEQENRIRENAIEIYELLNEFLTRYLKRHILLDRAFIDRCFKVIDKCEGGIKCHTEFSVGNYRPELT